MKKVIIELYLSDDQPITDLTVGRALGEAIMTNQVHYCTEKFYLEHLELINKYLVSSDEEE